MVGDGVAAGVRFGAGDAGDLRGFGVDLEVPFAGRVRPGGRRLPLRAHARRLAARRGRASPAPGSASARPISASWSGDLPGPVGVLAMGDGSARRTVKAPGYLDDAAGPFDAAVARRWPPGTPRRSPRSTPERAERLLAAGVPTWRAVGAALAGRDVTARLHLRRRRPSASATSSPTGSAAVTPPPVVAVVGPTATGKTALAVALAQRLGGEVVNADSMQLYRGMDIGTAKPDARRARRRAAPPARPLARPRGGVRRRVPATGPAPRSTGCAAAGVVPLLVGGSGLYVRAVLDELEFPGTDAAVRARLEAELADVGPAELHGRLARPRPGRGGGGAAQQRTADRPRAGGHRADRRPVPRAAARSRGRTTRPSSIGLDRDTRRARRAGRRCGWTACGRPGFVDEVAALAADGLREGPTASRALGYAQVLAQFDGELTAEEARERTVTTTRRFVRRQRSWFRRDAALTWFDAAPRRPRRRRHRA